MKTRSNMPLFVLECDNVKTLSNSQIDLLRCGDYLVKKDATGEHAYKVTFKSATGMCLTYHDASVIETQSYDKIDGVWTYNSEDKTPNLLEVVTEDDIEGGTLENAKPIYWHGIFCDETSYTAGMTFVIINNSSESITATSFKAWVLDICTNYGEVVIALDGNIYQYEDLSENQHTGVLTALICDSRLISDNKCYLVSTKTDGTIDYVETDLDDLFAYFSIFTDRKNKLN